MIARENQLLNNLIHVCQVCAHAPPSSPHKQNQLKNQSEGLNREERHENYNRHFQTSKIVTYVIHGSSSKSTLLQPILVVNLTIPWDRLNPKQLGVPARIFLTVFLEGGRATLSLGHTFWWKPIQKSTEKEAFLFACFPSLSLDSSGAVLRWCWKPPPEHSHTD